MFERGGCLIAKLSDEALLAITEIINRGNSAVVRRRGNGVYVMEENRKIKYENASPNRERSRVIGAER